MAFAYIAPITERQVVPICMTSLEQQSCLMIENAFGWLDHESGVSRIEQRKKWKGVLGDSNANKGVVGRPYQSADRYKL